MAISCYSNLKGFAMTRPPLVVFTCCLLALSFATIYLAHCVDQYENLPNPDIPYDWNTLLSQTARLDLCALPEKSFELKSTATVENSDGDEIISKTAALELSKELHSKLGNDTKISGNITAALLGLKGSHNITVSFVLVTNSTNGVHHDHTLCATFTGPKSELPKTETPPQCQSKTGAPGEKFSQLIARRHGPEEASDWCSEGTELRLAYQSNSNLTPTLTVTDKTIINLHLMHTSYFLLVMALALICYALIKGRNSHSQIGDHEKVPLGL